MNNKKKEMNVMQAFRWMYRYIRPYRGWFYANIASIGLMVALNMLKIYYVKKLVDIAVSRRFEDIYGYVLIILAVAAGGMAVSFAVKYSSGKYGIYASRDMKDHLVGHINKLPVSEIENKHSSSLISLIQNELLIVSDFICEQFPNTASLLAMFIAALIFMLSVSPKLLIFCFIFIPVSVYLVGKLSSRIKSYSKKQLEQVEKSNGIILDTLNGLEIIKAYCTEKEFLKKYEEVLDKSVEFDIKSKRISTVMLVFMITIFSLPYAVCIVLGGYLALKGQILIGSLVAFMQLLEYIIDPLLMYKDIISSVKGTSSAIERINAVFETEPERENGETVIDDVREKIIEFREVYFSYDGRKDVLSNLNLSILRNEKVALVGGSGAGKSTIFNLLCSFYEANSGSIKLFGKDINNYSLAHLREQISFVSQNVYLFSGTVKENIQYGKTSAGETEVIEAAKFANVHEFILSSDKGYDTEVGESGSRFSGGQKQRISIARSLLKDAPILLLDEATSALDNHSDTMIQEAIDKYAKGRTTLVIAHKLSTIKNADRILVLEDGKIIEEGNHEDLIKNNTKYKQLYYKQFLAETEKMEEGTSLG